MKIAGNILQGELTLEGVIIQGNPEGKFRISRQALFYPRQIFDDCQVGSCLNNRFIMRQTFLSEAGGIIN